MKSNKILLGLISAAAAASLIACGNENVVKNDVSFEEFKAAVEKVEDTPNNHVEFTGKRTNSADSSENEEVAASLTCYDGIWEFDAESESQDSNALIYSGMELKSLVKIIETEMKDDASEESSVTSVDETEAVVTSTQKYHILGADGFKIEISEEAALNEKATTAKVTTGLVTADKYGKITCYSEQVDVVSYVGEGEPYKVESTIEVEYDLVWSKVSVPGGDLQEVTAAAFKEKAEKVEAAPYTYAITNSEAVTLFGNGSYENVLYTKGEDGKWATTESKNSSNVTKLINKTALDLYEESVQEPEVSSEEESASSASEQTTMVTTYYASGDEMKILTVVDVYDPEEDMSSKRITSVIFDKYGYPTSFRLSASISGLPIGSEHATIAWSDGEVPAATSEDSSASV